MEKRKVVKYWKRNCPKCENEIFYSSVYSKIRAENRNTSCFSCNNKGKNNPMYGKIRETSEEVRNKIKNSLVGIKRTNKTKRKQRLSAIKTIERNKLNGGQLIPGYNPLGCEIINWLNMYYDFNFQHAENGGEVCIDGYWPDGVDEKRKTIIEIDEKRHFDANGRLKKKDVERQKYLESLRYEFIRVKI